MNAQPWTDEEIDYAKQLHADGISAGVAARTLTDRFGRHFSRNAVIGKWQRSGMPRRQVVVKLERGEGHRTNNPSPRVATIPRVAKLSGHQPTETSLAAEDIPLRQRKSLFELEHHHCRFPYGEPGQDGFFFCGADNREGVGCYCLGHAWICMGQRFTDIQRRQRVAAIRRLSQERIDAAVRGVA